MFPSFSDLATNFLRFLIESTGDNLTEVVSLIFSSAEIDLNQPWIAELRSRFLPIGAILAAIFGTIAFVIEGSRKGLGGIVIVLGRLLIIPVVVGFSIILMEMALTIADSTTGMITTDLAGDISTVLLTVTQHIAADPSQLVLFWAFTMLLAWLTTVALLLLMLIRSSLVVILLIVLYVIIGPSLLDSGMDGLKRTVKFLVALIVLQPALAVVFTTAVAMITPGGEPTFASAVTGASAIILSPFTLLATIKFIDITGGRLTSAMQHASLAPASRTAGRAAMGVASGGSAVVAASKVDKDNTGSDILAGAQVHRVQRQNRASDNVTQNIPYRDYGPSTDARQVVWPTDREERIVVVDSTGQATYQGQ